VLVIRFNKLTKKKQQRNYSQLMYFEATSQKLGVFTLLNAGITINIQIGWQLLMFKRTNEADFELKTSAITYV